MLISDISHQVKTPVSNLQMVTDTLLTKPVSEEERMDFLQGIRSQTDKLDFLFQALVKTSRLETGAIRLEWDTDCPVRPKWDDGSPAHTIKLFGVINRYDLRKEFPILTVRRTYWKTAVDELLWIWQKKSNNIHDLNSKIWDQWADETGSIGKAYGYQLGVKHHYPQGDMDQVDKVLWDLKHDPASRRIMTNLYNHHDLSEMALYPCAYSMTSNVSGNTLNAILNQRSQDMLTANGWNVTQYAILLHMIAQVSGLEAGELVHVIADAHIYDRHVPVVEKLLEAKQSPAPKFIIDQSVTNFYAFTRDSFSMERYTPAEFHEQIPVAV